MNAPIPTWKIRLFWLLLFSGLVLATIKFVQHQDIELFARKPKLNPQEQKEELKFSFYRVLFDYGIRVDWIAGDNYYKIVRVPKDLPIVEPYAALVARFEELGGVLLKARSRPLGDEMVLEVGLDGEPLFHVTLVEDPDLQRFKGRIAIVIDDFGYFFNGVVEGFLNLPERITFSILPGLTYSEKIAQAAYAENREVMLHLPMEPKNGHFEADDYILLTNMQEQEIRDRAQKAIKSVPHVRGINNHMGSLATENETLLKIVMSEIKKAGLFFLDSRTSPNSLAFTWARKNNIPCAINNTFLDSIAEEPFIRQQVNLLAEMAARNGQAVGIGHPNELTLKVLQEELPQLEKRGFQFVAVSNLLE